MCHELWRRRDSRRDERFDEELQYLLDEEREKSERPLPVLEQDDEPAEPERLQTEAGTRA
jgi:hypothetical protein